MHRASSPAPHLAEAAPSERILRGRLIGGRYVIEQLIGSGAMGRVYSARHVALGRVCAIKVIREQSRRTHGAACAERRSASTVRSDPGFWGSSEPRASFCSSSDASCDAVARFQIEARAAGRLDHPNIVQVVDFGCDAIPGGEIHAIAPGAPGERAATREVDLWYLVTEHLDGEDLVDLMNAEPILPTSRIVAIMRQVCAALQHAHDAGVIHRDIKPENIRLVPRVGDDGELIEHVKLIDFGTAKLLHDSPQRWLPGAPPLDDDGDRLVIGTPAYMSPEQAAGQLVDARSDVYACGVVLFEMATGRLPFDRSTPIALAAAHVECPPPPPSAFNAAIDPDLEALILRCLRKNPDGRPESARRLRDELDRIAAAAAAYELGDENAPANDATPAEPRGAEQRRSPWAEATLRCIPVSVRPARIETSAPIPLARRRQRAEPRPAQPPRPPKTRHVGARLGPASPALLASLVAASLGGSLCVALGAAGSFFGAEAAPPAEPGPASTAATSTADGGVVEAPQPTPCAELQTEPP